MPELLRSAKLAIEKGLAPGRNESYVKQLSDFIIPALVEALHKVFSIHFCPLPPPPLPRKKKSYWWSNFSINIAFILGEVIEPQLVCRNQIPRSAPVCWTHWMNAYRLVTYLMLHLLLHWGHFLLIYIIYNQECMYYLTTALQYSWFCFPLCSIAYCKHIGENGEKEGIYFGF